MIPFLSAVVIMSRDKNEKAPVPDSRELLDLVEACGRGEEQAIAEFFSIYSEDVYNFPLKVFHLDEDAASDFFLYAYERLREGARFRSFQGRSSFRTWFYAVLRNLVIDWMRTIREVNTVNFNSIETRGGEINMAEAQPDPRSLRDAGEDFAPFNLTEVMEELGMNSRVTFKLCFLYYLELDSEELEYIQSASGKNMAELIEYLAELKNQLAEKELKNIGSEDKITSLYLSILDLKAKKERMIDDSVRQGLSAAQAEESFEIVQITRAIEKKYQQREKLLEKKEKGHFVVRTPYKYIAELLGAPEGNISVLMMRVLERLRANSRTPAV